MKKFGAAVGTILAMLAALVSILLAFFLSWCKWFGAAWVLSHLWNFDPIKVGTMIFVIANVIAFIADRIMKKSPTVEVKM